jgi:chromosome segregation protein
VYLKRIVLHGFKSFADRTEFEFGPGLTMVVGPNGCGKSNILDALRWVLGEQSARSLRGHKMLDVIFAGSRSRKPANAASVELTFDNRTGFLSSDEPEVSVGRVLYRNGDSEYRINGKVCRLKDIRHLFLDTGVGVDAYSIIEQGRVDMLLQANPLERREIFEEAAGVSRYKVQRAEAARKLDRTQNNLLRLNDVVDELERRLRSVKLAAGKARRWQEYDARLREQRSTFSLAEYHELECRRRETQQQITDLNEELQALRTELATQDAEAAEQERILQQLDEQIQGGEACVAERQTELSALAERIAQGERRLGDLAASRDRRRSQATELAERAFRQEQRIADETAALAALVTAAEQSVEHVAELRTAHSEAARERDEARTALEQAKTAAFEAVRRTALLHNEQNSLGAQRERLQAQTARLAQRGDELTRERSTLVQQRDEGSARVAALDARGNELTGELRQAESRAAELQARRSELDEQIGAAKVERSAILSRLDLLEQMQRRLEGVDRGTQAVLGWGAGTGSVAGLVADLLQIDDPRVWALQPVLSTFESHVVVENTYTLLSELARQEKLSGPVRVLALDRLPAEFPRTDYAESPGFVARAADWVACRPEHRPLAEHLLGRVIVVDEIERALALAGSAPEGYIFVTLDGRMVGANGRLLFGTREEAAGGLISRLAEIRQLRLRRDEIETGLERAVRERNEVQQARSDAQVRRDELLNGIATVQKEHAEARAGLTRLEGELNRAEREAVLLDSELAGAQRSMAEIEADVQRLAAESSVAGEEQRVQEDRIEAQVQVLREREAVVERCAAELTDAQVEAGRTKEKRVAGEESLAAQQAARTALLAEQDQAEREAQAAEEQMAVVERESAEAGERCGACADELARVQADVLALRERRQELRLRQESGGAHTHEVRERLHERETSLHESEVAQRELDVRQENLVARIREDLGLDLAERYATYEHTEQDWDAIREEIDELREKIARLGNVNLDALAELEELTPRHENLTAQRADLLAAVERLQALIAELDEESRSRFAATFEQIRVNFQELFRKLFGGGKADIILEDPERPLECGIEIIARPPGKEPQSISLLSGGEKTMTAVGLVMAVFKSKPSPFAFLDEVDAALDEANTERFNTLLQDFLAHSQFVVITHSKRTMQNADVLYGITMEEAGVSKRVSVRFEDRVDTPNVA